MRQNYFSLIFLFFAGWISAQAQLSPDADGDKSMRHTGADHEVVVNSNTQAIQEFVKGEIPQRGVLEWTIEATYEIPQAASGLAWDGTYLYCGIYGSNGDEIYQIDPATGDYSLFLNAPIEDSYGLTYDGTNFWTVSQEGSSSDPATARQFDSDGNVVDEFTLPAHYMSGITYDGGDLWTAAYYDPDGHIYKTDDEGNLLDDFAAPDNQPWDLTVEGSNIWMADKWGDAIYQIDKATGDLIATYPSEHTDPSGITWDGQYLWYIDEGEGSNFWLYKVNLSGSGSPVINVPVTSYNYGLVNVGQDETWNMTVENTGSTDLTLTGLEINNDQLSTTTSFPVTVAPGDDTEIPVTFDPYEFGELDEVLVLTSNDPLNGAVEISLSGNGVFDGPVASFSAESHNYGVIRQGASERWDLTIENHGDEMLTVSDLSITHDDFYVLPGFELPMDIPVLDEGKIGVWFNPQEVQSYATNMIVNTNDPENSAVTVSLSGEGEEPPTDMGEELWVHYIDEGYDNSVKAIVYLPDLNQDGEHEIVTASEDNYIRCLNGNSDDPADVLWETEIYSGNLYGQNSIMCSADLNDDAIDDVVVGTTGGDRSVRALSGADGEMLWKFETNMYGNGGWVYQVHSKQDYNEDGIPDVLAACGDDGEDNGPKRIFCLNGINGDMIWEKYAGGPAFSVIGVDDFTGDGLADVVAGASDESETQATVWGLDGADGDDVWSFEPGGSSVWALERLSDITGDGVSDVISGDFNGNYYLMDATDGSIIEQGGIGNELLLRFENAGKLNGDQYDDIAVAHSGTMATVIDGLNGDDVWTVGLEDKSWNVRVMNDVDGDSKLDIAVGTLYQSNYAYILSGIDGSEVMKKSFSEPIDGLGVIPDVVGDNSYEVVVGGREGTVRCFSGGNLLVSSGPAIVSADKLRHQAMPNPFSHQLTIEFWLSKSQIVDVEIRAMNGKTIFRKENLRGAQGINELRWNPQKQSGAKIPAGVYVYTIKTAEGVVSGKIVKQ